MDEKKKIDIFMHEKKKLVSKAKTAVDHFKIRDDKWSVNVKLPTAVDKIPLTMELDDYA